MFNLKPGAIVHVSIDDKWFTAMVYKVHPTYLTLANIHFNNKKEEGELTFVDITSKMLDDLHVIIYASEKGKILYDSKKVYENENFGNLDNLDSL